MKKDGFVAIDIGGTWIKAVLLSVDAFTAFINTGDVTAIVNALHSGMKRMSSPLNSRCTREELLQVLYGLIRSVCTDTENIDGIGISTTGIVNYHGTQVELAAVHLRLLTDNSWTTALEKRYGCPVVLVNDADAACIGLAELGYLQGPGTIGVMVIGTGLGFSVWKNGRSWKPGKRLPLLGSIRTPSGTYNEIASVSRLSSLDAGGDLASIFRNKQYFDAIKKYLQDLAGTIVTAGILYQLDEVVLSSGMVSATAAAGFPLAATVEAHLTDIPELKQKIKLRLVSEGNVLQLLGACSVIAGEQHAQQQKKLPGYADIHTEMPYDSDLQLHRLTAEELVQLMWRAEQEAGLPFEKNIGQVARIAEKIAVMLGKGGRLIYVGAGTSGRIAAMDAIEIPVTYGVDKSKVLAVVAGGISDASMEIESDFEEDASSVPQMLLLKIGENDMVVGISASGSSYFVQSALAFARQRGAYTVFIRNELPKDELSFCHEVVPLHSGHEVVGGSTRMKAGTSTKKILNFLSSVAMIVSGKTRGSYMIDMICVNQKLVSRARSILSHLYGISDDEAMRLLQENDLHLRKAIEAMERGRKK